MMSCWLQLANLSLPLNPRVSYNAHMGTVAAPTLPFVKRRVSLVLPIACVQLQ